MPDVPAPSTVPSLQTPRADDECLTAISLNSEAPSVDFAPGEPPVLTRFGEFADRDVEHEYRTAELRARYVQSMSRVTAVVGTVGIILSAVTPASTGRMTPHALTYLALTSTAWAVFTFVRAAHLHPAAISLAWVERVSTGWFAAASAGVLSLNTSRLAHFVDGPLPAEACALEGLSALLLRAFCFVLAAGLYTPMCTAHLSLVSLSIGIALVVPDFFVSCPMMPRASPSDAGVFLTLAVFIALAHTARVRTERGQFHFKRSMIAAASAWRRVQKQEHEQRVKAHALESTSGARSRLIRAVMHDLRSPLLAIHSAAEQMGGLQGDTRLDDACVGLSLSAMLTCSRVMQGIVSDMLDFERIDSGRMALVLAPFTVAQLFADARHTFEPIAQGKKVRLVFKAVPPAVQKREYVGDVRRLLQCVSNGLSNAIKFSEPGQTITVGARDGHDAAVSTPASFVAPSAQAADADADGLARVCIFIADEGLGLSAEDLHTVRKGDAFTQVGKGQLQGSGGTGLGLSIVRQILALHNGSTLSLDSAGERQGVTFTLDLVLPLAHTAKVRRHAAEDDAVPAVHSHSLGMLRAQAATPTTEAVASAPAPVVAASRARRMSSRKTNVLAPTERAPRCRCLHAEDDKVLQLVLARQLFKRLHVEFTTVADGALALDAVEQAAGEQHPYTVVLIDNQMPRVGGAEATRKLRQSGFPGMIIGMTGDPSGSPERAEFEAAGLDMCVDKSPDGLKCIEEVIRCQLEQGA